MWATGNCFCAVADLRDALSGVDSTGGGSDGSYRVDCYFKSVSEERNSRISRYFESQIAGCSVSPLFFRVVR
jgi:hypothetical protein